MNEDTETEIEEAREAGEEIDADLPAEENQEANKIEDAIQQAQQYHQMLDEAKEWANNQGVSMRTQAEMLEQIDEDATEEDKMRLHSVADRIHSVYRRIERGDSNIAKE